MYCPKINYCFSMDDVKKLNQEIRIIAENYEIDNGWFHENEGRQFIDEQGNVFAIDVLGRFSQRFEPDYELHYVRLKKDGMSFDFDVELFSEHI